MCVAVLQRDAGSWIFGLPVFVFLFLCLLIKSVDDSQGSDVVFSSRRSQQDESTRSQAGLSLTWSDISYPPTNTHLEISMMEVELKSF